VSPWKVILATMVIFACGLFTGVFVTRIVPAAAPVSAALQPLAAQTNKAPLPPFAQLQVQRPEFLKRLDRQLDLSPDQHDRMVKIMSASRERTAPLWQEIAPQMSAELKRVRGEIRQVLTPEQRKKWAELNKRAAASAAGSSRPDSAERPAVVPPPDATTN
jgi:Spy/CpxP family protein refolding chaperone